MALRQSGISLLGEVPWGTHFCQFYQTRNDLLDILVPYFKAGLENNEFCMWVTSDPLGPEEAKNALFSAVPDLNKYISNGQIEFLKYSEWYTKDGSFEADRVLSGWLEKMEKARARGFDGLRLTGNTFWLEREDWDSFTAYEQKVNETLYQFPILALCTYSLEKCKTTEILDVVSNHEFALIRTAGDWRLIESSEVKRTKLALEASNKELETERANLALANAELARSNKELEEFAYVASHDLQEPLRAISNYVQLIDKRYKGRLDKDADDFINFTVDGARRMQTLINDLLAYSRAGTRGKAFSPVLAGNVLQLAIRNITLTMGNAGAEITHDELPAITGDEEQLAHLFQNLFTNAIKFRKKDEPPRIHVSAEHRENEGWVFSIKDNGIGMEPKYSERIFQIFQRLHSREYEGTGIGLAICKKIVERHGGRIWVESAPGEGSIFYFTIHSGK